LDRIGHVHSTAASGGDNQTSGPDQPVPAWPPQWDLYNKHAGQAWTDQQTSSDDFDKNLLTLSSVLLGFSLAFIKDIVRWIKLGSCAGSTSLLGVLLSLHRGHSNFISVQYSGAKDPSGVPVQVLY